MDELNQNLQDKLLDKVIKAHGGLDRWNRIKSIDLTWNFTGSFLALKGYPGHYRPIISIDTSHPRAVIQGLGAARPDDRWHLDWDHVWIETSDGSIVSDQPSARASFQGHIRSTPWTDLQLTYFVGYAIWNYFCAPFLFTWPGFSTRELEPHKEAGQTWRVLEVTYPDGFPTHTKVQKLYYDHDTFLLQRMDYVTDVAGGVAAHYCFDHKDFDALIVPTLRRVVRRNEDSPVIHGPSAFLLDYVSVTIHDKE